MKLLKVIQLHRSEQKLIEKAVANSRKAQKELYEIYAPKMLSVCRYYIRDLQDAEDIMISSFFKAFQSLNKFNGSGSFEGWLRRIMVNQCISFLRKKKEMYLSDNIENLSEEFDNGLNENFDVAEIQNIIDDLPNGYKMVFVLYAIEGYKHQEIAEMLGISINTSKTQLFKARKILQQKLQEINIVGNGTR